ncbi:MAG: methylated-DNA--[protein]-cysteine S-methyltransferase [Vulcanimicrobiota bacterium]
MKSQADAAPDKKFTGIDTYLGRFFLIWSDNGVTDIIFPGESESELMRRLKGCRSPHSKQVPLWIKNIVSDIQTLLETGSADLTAVPLDMSGIPPFHQKVYNLVKTILPGQVKTYGEVARLCDSPGAARAVGHAMATNPFPLVVPCHRVIASTGAMGGFSAPGGIEVKKQLLLREESAANAG